MASRRGTRRDPRRAAAGAAVSYHPTKGFRRVSFKRVAAQGLMARQVALWSAIGAAAR